MQLEMLTFIITYTYPHSALFNKTRKYTVHEKWHKSHNTAKLIPSSIYHELLNTILAAGALHTREKADINETKIPADIVLLSK